MSAKDEEPTAEELAEAARLAAALEGRSSERREAPEDALETASLLRFASGAFALDEQQRDAIIEQALAEARPPAAPRSWIERFRWRSFAVIGALGAATAVLALVLRGSSGPTALPLPTAGVLEAQINALQGADLATLDRTMQPYRGDVYAVLERRYGR